MTLQAKLDAIREDFETNKAQAEVVTIFHAHKDHLSASGQAPRAISVGQTAPEFNLPGRGGIANAGGTLQRPEPGETLEALLATKSLPN